MALRGRKPKPTHLKLVTGNPGRRPLNKREAVIARQLPVAPPHLLDEAKLEWGRVARDLWQAGLLTKADRGVMAAYCQAWARVVQAETALAHMATLDRSGTSGLLVQTSNGNAVQNPLVGIRNKAWADVVRYAAELGMTPSARSRITAEPPDDEDDPAKKYIG